MDSMFTDAKRPRSGARPESRDEGGMDSLHRIVTGQALNRTELNVAGIFIGGWFLMDLVQWLDWLASKLH